MEDGTVSIFGLVFGVAALTGSGPLSLPAPPGPFAAVSMMAGAFLIESEQGVARAQRPP